MAYTLGLACVLIFAAFQVSANFSGKWFLSSPGRNGTRSLSILTISQAGQKLTGTLAPDRGGASAGPGTSSDIYGAKVEGNTISFYVWRGSDKPAKQFYRGVMHDEVIDFTVTGGPPSNFPPPNGQPTGAALQVTARRSTE